MAADNSTQSLSLSLYHYLCQNIVGYEGHVKTLRMVNNVRDNSLLTDGYVIITSGSFGEGLEIKGSDLDIMRVSKIIEVHENLSSVVQNNDKTYFSINTEDTKPGFTYLSFECTTDEDMPKMCIDVRGKLCLSNVMFKQMFVAKHISVVHGPCLSDKYGELDICICLHSKSWITSANQWITRPNNSWPSVEVKQTILDHGVLFVPIGVKGSENEDVEWRLSFSVAEKLLIHTFSHTQLLCYALVKILLKDVINMNKKCKDLICSYFLKTIIFWVSEEIHPSLWSPENLLLCFMRCFRRLIYCVEYSICPHYFIPENNLFENKIQGIERRLLLCNLYTLHSYNWRCIFFSPQITQFNLPPNQNIPSIAFICSFQNVVNSKNLYILTNILFGGNFRKRYVRLVHNLRCLHSSRFQSIHLHHMSVLSARVSQDIQPTRRNCNKFQYNQYNTCLSYLLQNMHHDSVSGLLMLASFFYRTQQYNYVLDLTLYSLSKCTLGKLCHGKDLSVIHIQLLNFYSIRKKGIINTLKLLSAKPSVFAPNSSLIPTELQMDVNNYISIIPAVVYAFFLRVLCHHHLNNARQCRESIRDLQLTIAEGYFIPNGSGWKALSYNCLGVALQLLGETENAKQAFLRSIELWPVSHLNTAFKRLSLI